MLTAEQKALAEQYVPYARQLTKKSKQNFPHHFEEIDSAALFALLEAAKRFDPEAGVKFPTFAAIRILGAVKDTIRQIKKDEKNLHYLGSSMHAMETLLMEKDENTLLDESIDTVRGMIRKLPKVHQPIMEAIYVHGMTHAKAAEHVGLSASRVSYVHIEALSILRGDFRGQRDRSQGHSRSTYNKKEDPFLREPKRIIRARRKRSPAIDFGDDYRETSRD